MKFIKGFVRSDKMADQKKEKIRVDIKSVKISAIGNLLNNPDAALQNNKLMLLTDASLIYGTFVNQNDLLSSDSDIELVPHKLSLEASKQMFYSSQRNGNPTINDSVTIILKDVTIMPFSSPNVKINLSALSLFTDQIVGFTYGSLS